MQSVSLNSSSSGTACLMAFVSVLVMAYVTVRLLFCVNVFVPVCNSHGVSTHSWLARIIARGPVLYTQTNCVKLMAHVNGVCFK